MVNSIIGLGTITNQFKYPVIATFAFLALSFYQMGVFQKQINFHFSLSSPLFDLYLQNFAESITIVGYFIKRKLNRNTLGQIQIRNSSNNSIIFRTLLLEL